MGKLGGSLGALVLVLGLLIGAGCIVNEESDDCECTCDYFARKLDLRAEAQTNLDLIFRGEVSYHGENNTYGHTFDDIAFYPSGDRRYAYFLEGQTIQPNLTLPYQLPADLNLSVTLSGFNAVAVGNIDCDDTLDVWQIDQDRTLVNLVDDLTK